MTKKPTTAQEEEKSEGIVAEAKAFRNYLELSKTELRKVTWPTVKETRYDQSGGVGLRRCHGDLPRRCGSRALQTHLLHSRCLMEKPMESKKTMRPQGAVESFCPTVPSRSKTRAVRIDCAGHFGGVHSSDRVERGRPPDTGKSRWYIVHTYSGFEQRVEATIKEMMRNAQDNGLIHEVVVPTEKVIELGKGGAKRTTTRKFYPGYIMLRMTMTDFPWHLVQSIPKVTGFVGGKNRPAPMKDEEAARILSLMETRQEQPRPQVQLRAGRRRARHRRAFRRLQRRC